MAIGSGVRLLLVDDTRLLENIIREGDTVVPELEAVMEPADPKRLNTDAIYNAVYCLKKIGTPRAADALEKHLSQRVDMVDGVRVDAIDKYRLFTEVTCPALWALEEMDRKPADDLVRRYLRIASVPVSTTACEYLLQWGMDDKEVVARLVYLTDMGNWNSLDLTSLRSCVRPERILKQIAESRKDVPRMLPWTAWFEYYGDKFTGRGWKLPREKRTW